MVQLRYHKIVEEATAYEENSKDSPYANRRLSYYFLISTMSKY